MPAAEHRSTLGLISEALSQVSQLMGSELTLARTEMGEKIAAAVAAILSIVGAAVFLVVALIFLLDGLVAWLVEHGWRPSTSSLTVGAAIGFVAIAAILFAKSRLSVGGLTPSRTLGQAGKTVDVLRGRDPS